MVASDGPSDVDVEQLTDWLFCLRTPVVQAYAVQQSTDFVLIDTGVVGYENAYLKALAEATGAKPEDLRVNEILLTHGHDDHTGSARELARIPARRCAAGPGHGCHRRTSQAPGPAA